MSPVVLKKALPFVADNKLYTRLKGNFENQFQLKSIQKYSSTENEHNQEILLQFLIGLQWKYWTADAHINSIKFLRSLLNWCEKHKTRFKWFHLPLNVLTRITMLCFPGYQNALQKKTVTFMKQNLTAGNIQFWAHYTFIVLSNSREPKDINKKT